MMQNLESTLFLFIENPFLSIFIQVKPISKVECKFRLAWLKIFIVNVDDTKTIVRYEKYMYADKQ